MQAKKTIIYVMALAAFLATGNAKAAPALFGIEVGEPFLIQECPPTADPVKWHAQAPALQTPSFPYAAPTTSECYKRSRDKAATPTPLNNEVVFVEYPANQKLDVASENTVNVLVSNGRAEWIRFGTNGLTTQDRDLFALMDKFGSSISVKRVALSNAFGAQYRSILAEWDLSNGIHAEFNSAGAGTANRGLVTLATERGRALNQEILDRTLKGNRPL